MCKDNNLDNFLYVFEYQQTIDKNLVSDNNLENYEKIILLFNFTGLISDVKSFEIFRNINFNYIKISLSEEGSAIKLSMKFLNDFIIGLNEESPSYFKLIEIHSKSGYYKDEHMFLFDMISLTDLKVHLKSNLPTVISFFTWKNSDNRAVINPISGGISINEEKLFEKNEKISLSKKLSEEKISQVKNIAMILFEELSHECFGHRKFQFHSFFCYYPDISTPFKCIERNTIKKLVQELNFKDKKNINILYNKNKSDSGNYFESSFGKLSGTKLFTFSYLKRISNPGKLLDNPLLFTQKEKLEILQKYCFYKFKYEHTAGNINDLNKYKSFEEEYNFLINYYNENEKTEEEKEKKGNIENEDRKNEGENIKERKILIKKKLIKKMNLLFYPDKKEINKKNEFTLLKFNDNIKQINYLLTSKRKEIKNLQNKINFKENNNLNLTQGKEI